MMEFLAGDVVKIISGTSYKRGRHSFLLGLVIDGDAPDGAVEVVWVPTRKRIRRSLVKKESLLLLEVD